ncbi:MAG: lytic transglycosylase domain-containing protein [Algoriphagus sp.]|uniref:lytic transglycosylase domain-containing protein n=1 Tax=Algoriphagus sp. TaxID=1872435 RepID=UPI0017C7888A|nr:lytic transglycosylase domain-containing protein [Algoriphagus sp.]NVJ86558.1 lytic transglycosylase domain-containing protein [Algoriphagus sp.]
MNRQHFLIIYGLLALSLGLGVYLIFQQAPTSSNSGSGYPISSQGFLPQPVDSVRIFPIPENLSFAGEPVPLDQQDILERLEREIYVNAYWQSNMILLMKRSGKYLDEITRILKEEGIPEDFKYLAIAESGLMNVTSPAGAKGFWQFMQGTAKDYGLEVSRNVDERYHWQKSTLAATKYLKEAYSKFGNWTSVAASYNMGQTGFSKRQKEQLEEDYYHLLLNDETSRYMFRILAFKVIFENPKAYGFNLRESDYYKDPPLHVTEVNQDISNLAQWAKSKGYTYKELKIYNPWLRERNLNVRRGKTYQILLPEK